MKKFPKITSAILAVIMVFSVFSGFSSAVVAEDDIPDAEPVIEITEPTEASEEESQPEISQTEEWIGGHVLPDGLTAKQYYTLNVVVDGGALCVGRYDVALESDPRVKAAKANSKRN